MYENLDVKVKVIRISTSIEDAAPTPTSGPSLIDSNGLYFVDAAGSAFVVREV